MSTAKASEDRTKRIPANPAEIIEAVRNPGKFFDGSGKLKLDDDQRLHATSYPPGPQRIRGLAGTGKTLMLARRAAVMHHAHPDWNIAFVFFTKSLYNFVNERIEKNLDSLNPQRTWDKEKLQVLHAWGRKEIPGFYQLAARLGAVPFHNSATASQESGSKSPNVQFAYCCDKLERDLEAKRYSGLAGYFNAVIIDEGQDIPFSLYRVAFNALKVEKRLYWAYDEAQSLASFEAPEPLKIFGAASNGEPLVNLQRSYPGGLLKSPVFKYCYRTPQHLLMVANAVNMGLFRPAGPIQGISDQDGWKKIGYDVVKGEFKKGFEVVLRRNPKFLKHPLDIHPEIQAVAGKLLRLERFAGEWAEIDFIADEIRKDVKEHGISPVDIIVTPIKGDSEKGYLNKLGQALKRQGVDYFIPGDADEDFRQKGCVTLAGVWRAKGNEAHKVYVPRFHNVTQERRWMADDSERARRNEAFVALTRSRLWVVLTGLAGETGQSVFDEVERALQHLPELRFKGFSKGDFPKDGVQYEMEE